MSIIDKIFHGLHNSRISTKIMLTYVAAFAVLVFATNLLAWGAMSYGMYHQAEDALNESMTNIRELLETIEQNRDIDVNSIRDPLTTGVVLRAVADNGEIFFDTDPRDRRA